MTSTVTRPRPGTGTVVVGVDSSSASRAALGWAAEWATRSGARLRAVHVIAAAAPGLSACVDGWARIAESSVEDQERRKVAAMFDLIHPRPGWTLESVHGPVGTVLVEACADAMLLVLGARTPDPGGRSLVGAVADHSLRHAPCPVVVVPAAETLDQAWGQPA